MDPLMIKAELPEYTCEVIKNIKVEIEETEDRPEMLGDGGWTDASHNTYESNLFVCKEELPDSLPNDESHEIVTPTLTDGICTEQTTITQNKDLSKSLKSNVIGSNVFTNVKETPANSSQKFEYFIEILPTTDNQEMVNSKKRQNNSPKTRTIEKHKVDRKQNTIKVEEDSNSYAQSFDNINQLNAFRNNMQPSHSRALLRQDIFSNTNFCEVPTIDNVTKSQNNTGYREFTNNTIPVATKRFACNFCNHECNNKSNIARHVRLHFVAKKFTCDMCDFRCNIMTRLVKHRRLHTGEKPYSCMLCDYTCMQKATLVAHIGTHTGVKHKPFACEICDYKGSRREQLERHIKKKHDAIKIFICDHCNFQSGKRSSLVQHLGTHSSDKPYSCSVCIYKCRNRRLLENHMKVHTGEKPYSCNMCDFRCGLKCALVRHKRTHTGEKPYACQVCDYRSSRKEHLTRHMKIHPAGKLLSCDVCNFTCGLQRSLVRHMRSHLS